MRPSPSPVERVPLPTDAAGLPSLGSDADRALTDGLREMAIELSPAVLEAIDAHARLLAAWGRHVNLTAIREPVEVIRLHVLDSLSAVAPIRARVADVRSIVDVGSGGGYPGIPVGLALGAGLVSLVESVGRKARFLEVAGSATRAALAGDGSIDVEVLPIRAEQLAGGDRRASWDVATVRAVGSVAECAELGLPLVRPGGLLVCWKRHDVAPEVEDARILIDRLGGGTPEVVAADVPDSPAHRLVLVRKERPTPAAYPRPPATRRGPATRPGHPGRGRTRRS
jgi:16S rRNA (guanine527-N7)-methyltransferase